MPIVLTGVYDPEPSTFDPIMVASEATYYGDNTTTWVATVHYVDNTAWTSATTSIATNTLTGDELWSNTYTGSTAPGTVTTITYPTDQGLKIVVVGPNGEIIEEGVIAPAEK